MLRKERIKEADSRLYFYQATVVRVIDGDTIVVDIDEGFHSWLKNITLRVLGIDAPEMKGGSKPRGIASKNHVISLLPVGTSVVVKTHEQDNFGRWLATVYLPDGRNLSEEMIASGFAVRKDQ